MLAGTLMSSLVLLVFIVSVYPDAQALPSFARQTGQRCSSCHVGGNWPQLTPWGRFFSDKPMVEWNTVDTVWYRTQGNILAQ